MKEIITIEPIIILPYKSRGLGQAEPEPSREWRLWPGLKFHKAKAASSQAKAAAFRPSRAVHSPICSKCHTKKKPDVAIVWEFGIIATWVFQAAGGSGASLINHLYTSGTRLTSHPGPGIIGGTVTWTYIENMVRYRLVSNYQVMNNIPVCLDLGFQDSKPSPLAREEGQWVTFS